MIRLLSIAALGILPGCMGPVTAGQDNGAAGLPNQGQAADLALPDGSIEPMAAFTIAGYRYSPFIYRDPTAGVAWFNAAVHQHGTSGDIVACSLLIDVPVGVADGNHSYGGYCTLRDHGHEDAVKICNDVMVGHFLIVPAGGDAPSKAKLAQFVAAHCFGG